MSDNKAEVQKKVMELQMLQHQAREVQRQAQMLEQQAGEMELVQQAIDDLSRAKAGSESFVTLTPGVFVKARIENTESVLLNVGGGAVVEKAVPDAKELIARQTQELRKMQDEMVVQLQKIMQHAEKSQEELRALVKQKESK